MNEKIAIIGGGIAGLMASYLLNKRYPITLYEKADRIGGNARTYSTRDGHEVDIAVAAFGMAGYKNFFRLLNTLNVKTSMCAGSYMSMHNLDTGKGLYITPFSLKGLCSQRFDLFTPGRIRSFIQIHRALKKAQALLDAGKFDGMALEEAIRHIPELSGDALLLFMFTLCLLSSMYYEEVLDCPARFFIEKLRVHHDVMSPRSMYSVRCVTNKTKAYVQALASHYQDKIVLNSKIAKVLRNDKDVTLVMEDGQRVAFDKVVFACPADQALNMIDKPTEEETRLLGAWRYKDGTIVVHRDHSSFPKKELIQAYTFLYTEKEGKINTSVSGALWHEPGVSKACEYISSQHPNFPIKEDLIELQTVFRTPIFDSNSYPTIKDLPSLNGVMNSYYCGSHFGHGLHEDAVSSAIEVAKKLGVTLW